MLCLLLLACLAVAFAAALPALLPPPHGATGAAPADEPAGPAGTVWASTGHAAAPSTGATPSSGAKDLLPHLALVPGERVQGPVYTCWVWAATAVTEVALDVQKGVRDRLSVEYFDATYHGGSGPGWAGDRGWVSDYAAQLSAHPVLVPWSNANASYRDGNGECRDRQGASVEASAIATDPHYAVAWCEARRIPTGRVGTGAAVENVRAELDADRAVFVGFTLPNATARQAFQEFWTNGTETDVWDPSPWLAADEGGTAFSHAVACVGYDSRDLENRYWVMLNSWGTANGRRPSGTFRMRMDLDYDLPVYREHPDGSAIAFEALTIEFADPPRRSA